MSGWWMEVVPPTDQNCLVSQGRNVGDNFRLYCCPTNKVDFLAGAPSSQSFAVHVYYLLLKQWQLLFLLFPATILFFLCIIRFLPTILIIPSNLYFSNVQ